MAAELAERENAPTIEIVHLDAAEDKIERDRVFDIVTTQPKQSQAALFALIQLADQQDGTILTGQIYEVYKKLCPQFGLKPLTQRRIGDIIAEMDMLGIITAKVISKGRYGRTREISLAIPQDTQGKITTLLKETLFV